MEAREEDLRGRQGESVWERGKNKRNNKTFEENRDSSIVL